MTESAGVVSLKPSDIDVPVARLRGISHIGFQHSDDTGPRPDRR